MPAGIVFEGEKQFDLVVRYDQTHRQSIENIETASIQLPNGNKVPLSEFADISYTKGPAKISRDNTKRRIVVGVNVRNRDLESVVKDVQTIIQYEIKVPVGYTIEYGGQFENLRSARARLMIAVPIALVLIFVLLYFAFNSVKEALMIYSAIPLSAVGGVLLLYIRDLPFSISAGVGFIALFGIAVLNGIVLIEHFKELKGQGYEDINKRIVVGTQQRLRPVLLTAAAAALGFLPMAISTSAGAEVQRPLATVVVGGLISATALTLIVLPVLYALFDSKEPKKKLKTRPVIIALLAVAVSFSAQSQTRPISLEEAVGIAVQNNQGLKASASKITQSTQLVKSAFNLDKTQLYYLNDQNNIAENGIALRTFGISQSFQFPTVYGAQKKVQLGLVDLNAQQYEMDKRLVSKEVSKSYYTVLYWQNVVENYRYLDSLFRQFSIAASRRFEEGETNYLEKLTAEAKQRELGLLLQQGKESVEKAYIQLQQWLQSDSNYTVPEQKMPMLSQSNFDVSDNPGLKYFELAQSISSKSLTLQQQKLLPDLHLNLFQGTNNGSNSKRYSGFQAGIGIPLFFGAERSRIEAAKIQMEISDSEFKNYKTQLLANLAAQQSDLKKYQEAIDYYHTSGQMLSEALISNGASAFQNGEIDFLQYIQLLDNAKSIEITYLENLFNYNLTLLEINYISNQQ